MKSYRKTSTGYRFIKTKDISKVLYFRNMLLAIYCQINLEKNLDKLFYLNKSYSFLLKTLTKKEIGASKLRVLRYKKIKTGILKNKEV